MCVLGHLPEIAKWDFRILATDISTRVLQAASRGVYSEEKIQKVPLAIRQANFQQDQQRKWETGVRDSSSCQTDRHFSPSEPQRALSVQRTIRFHFLPKRNDLFRQEDAGGTRQQDGGLSQCPGGYFFVGHSESLTGLAHKLTYVRPAIYRN